MWPQPRLCGSVDIIRLIVKDCSCLDDGGSLCLLCFIYYLNGLTGGLYSYVCFQENGNVWWTEVLCCIEGVGGGEVCEAAQLILIAVF